MEKKKQKHSLFGSKQPPQPMPGPDIGAISRRISLLEQRSTNFNTRLQLIDQNLLNTNKKIAKDSKTVTSEINEIKLEIENLKETIQIIITELKESAKKEDIDVLKKYISFWEPMNFITAKEAEKIIKNLLEK